MSGLTSDSDLKQTGRQSPFTKAKTSECLLLWCDDIKRRRKPESESQCLRRFSVVEAKSTVSTSSTAPSGCESPVDGMERCHLTPHFLCAGFGRFCASQDNMAFCTRKLNIQMSEKGNIFTAYPCTIPSSLSKGLRRYFGRVRQRNSPSMRGCEEPALNLAD